MDFDRERILAAMAISFAVWMFPEIGLFNIAVCFILLLYASWRETKGKE